MNTCGQRCHRYWLTCQEVDGKISIVRGKGAAKMSSSPRNCGDQDKHVQLTSRQKAIIQILTKFTASRPVTVAMISEMMGVSSRTILREIPHIEQWMTQNDFHFIRKPGVGLILDESVENQKLILELLEVESIPKEYTKEERRRRILGELLYAEEPLKSYYFTSKFHISEGHSRAISMR